MDAGVAANSIAVARMILGQVAEAMRLAHGVAEVAIIKATSVRSQIKSRLMPLVKEAEEPMSCAVRE